MKIFFGIVFVILVLFGIVSAAYTALFLLLRPKKSERTGEYILLLGHDSKNIKSQLYFALLIKELLFGSDKNRVRVIDTGMNNVQREFCQALCGEYGILFTDKDGILTEYFDERKR